MKYVNSHAPGKLLHTHDLKHTSKFCIYDIEFTAVHSASQDVKALMAYKQCMCPLKSGHSEWCT